MQILGDCPNQALDRMRESAGSRTKQSNVMGALPLIGQLCRWAARSCVSKFDVVLSCISFLALWARRHVWRASVSARVLSVGVHRGHCLHVIPCVQFGIYIERHRRDSPTIQMERTRRSVSSSNGICHVLAFLFSRRAAHLERSAAKKPLWAFTFAKV